MANPIRIRPQVEGEIVEAMASYEMRSPGLGRSFYRRYVEILTVLSERPEAGKKNGPGRKSPWGRALTRSASS